ncbi:hypothetical protein DL93DRAFT_2075352 [Clavulina sp. PMI_390]|nr:hypothetical protein DL93DRAFT_2075352 [Clavulina sp. PMI_390]
MQLRRSPTATSWIELPSDRIKLVRIDTDLRADPWPQIGYLHPRTPRLLQHWHLPSRTPQAPGTRPACAPMSPLLDSPT